MIAHSIRRDQGQKQCASCAHRSVSSGTCSLRPLSSGMQLGCYPSLGSQPIFILEIARCIRKGKLSPYNTDASVPKSSVRLGVAVVDLVLWVILCAVVVGKLNETLTVPYAVAMGQGIRRVVAKKVQIELRVGEFQLLDYSHAKVFVELDGGLRVFDTDPG